MMRAHNFSAGPATLPEDVLKHAAAELPEYRGTGTSLIEASHRSAQYDEVHQSALSRVKQLLGIADTHEVLLLGGGATLQFSMVPLNLLSDGGSCDMTVTGSWAKKAASDAAKVGTVRTAFDGAPGKFTTLPDPETLSVPDDSRYLHITSNETIEGLQWKSFPDCGDVPIVADMSSDIMSRSVPIERFGIIYAGAQKNLGPAGVTVVIIRKDILERTSNSLPAYLSYRTHAEKESLYNTPPVFPIYMVNLVLEWVEKNGGLSAMEDASIEKSSLVYDAIDGSDGFYTCPVEAASRSRMNVVFRLPGEELEAQFLKQAGDAGMIGLKGHRSVGGIRASLYNALPTGAAHDLVAFMRGFASRNG